MKLFSAFVRTQQPVEPKAPVRSAPVLIDPLHFKHIGGGSPKGTWLAASGATVSSPKGTWA